MKGFFKRWLAGAALWALVIGIVSVVMLVVVFGISVLVARIDWRFGEGRRHVAGVVAIVVVNRRVVSRQQEESMSMSNENGGSKMENGRGETGGLDYEGIRALGVAVP